MVIIMRDGGCVGVQGGERCQVSHLHMYGRRGGGWGQGEKEVTGGDWHCAVTGRRYRKQKKKEINRPVCTVCVCVLVDLSLN